MLLSMIQPVQDINIDLALLGERCVSSERALGEQ